MRIQTQAIHAAARRDLHDGAVNTPIFQSSTYELSGQVSYDDLRYIRLNNTPNHQVVGGRIAALEGGEAAYVAASGMAAITATLGSLLQAGDHLLIERGCYGGTDALARHTLPRMGIEVDFFDADTPSERWPARENTRVVYTEAIANPTLRVVDHERVLAFARARGLVTVVDNTFPTPVFFRPLELGYDLVLHSATKYLNGHSDIVAGVVVGPSERVRAITSIANHLGGCLDPNACFLLERGLKTLSLRVRYQSETTQRLAELLEASPLIRKVHYPGLVSHPHHARASKWMTGFGGCLAFNARDAETAQAIIDTLQIALEAPSLGGVETLITRPVTSTHLAASKEDRARAGISDDLVRMSVGCEDPEDLLEDMAESLNAVAAGVHV